MKFIETQWEDMILLVQRVLQNFMMIGDWILVKGLMVQIDNTSLITDKHIITDGKMNSSKSTEDECLSIASSTISAHRLHLMCFAYYT